MVMPTAFFLALAGSLLLFAGQSLAQSSDDDGPKGVKILFHVTSVSQRDDPDSCPAAQCSATKFTVEGYADVQHNRHPTQYVLKCSEILVSNPSPHYAVTCGRVHSNNDYDATLFADSIYFRDRKPKQDGAPPEALYIIVSEKEVSMPSR